MSVDNVTAAQIDAFGAWTGQYGGPSSSTSQRGERYQTIHVSDMISEGPIYGLVEGESSIYLNNVRIKPFSQSSLSNINFEGERQKLTLNNSTTATVINEADKIEPPLPNTGSKYLILRGITSIANQTFTFAGLSGIATTSIGLGYAQAAFFTVSGLDLANYTSLAPRSLDSIPLRIKYQGKFIEFYALTPQEGATGVICAFPPNVDPKMSGETFEVFVDQILEISLYNGLEVRFPEPGTQASTNTDYYFNVIGAVKDEYDDSKPLDLGGVVQDGTNFSNISGQFRTGYLDQPCLESPAEAGSVSFTNTVPNPALNQIPQDYNSGTSEAISHNFGYDTSGGGIPAGVPVEITGDQIISGGNSSYRAGDIDQVNVIINYQNLIRYDSEGNKQQNYAFYYVDIQLERPGTDLSENTFIPIHGQSDYLVHNAQSTSPISFQLAINLENYRPFTNFKIRIARVTASDNGNKGTKSTGQPITEDQSRGSSSAQVSQVVAFINERFSYPFTAYSGVTFGSEEFSNIPRRSYDCKGLLIKVPSNYVTRDEASDGVAKYTRNPADGTIGSSPYDWDGEFRNEVYCNNPAWVLYDLLTNRRYGFGKWIEETDIDKYALYRAAKYCDELVPDGKGGLEPRFETNVYLTKAVEAYKLIKDLTSIFRGVLYWIDSQLTPVLDQPAAPIASFGPGNVLEGLFSYTGTGTKARPNQIIVSYTDPKSNYELRPLIVEDTENILETGRVLSQSLVAFGATSEGQAQRYARWKMWTDKNQTEIVSFKTGLQGATVFPGDIILVSDTNRYVKPDQNKGAYNPTRYAGRTISQSDGSSVELDRVVELAAGYSYTLSLYIATPSAFLSQTEATIGGQPYKQGDYIPTITSAEEASNTVDDSGNQVQVVWNNYSRVETEPVVHADTIVERLDTLIVSGTFSSNEIPANTMWVLNGTDLSAQAEISTSGKEYKVLAIKQEEPNIYAISAVEFYNEKFDSIEKGFSLFVEDTVAPPEDTGSVVPPPRSLVVLNTQDPKEIGNELGIQWTPPRNVNNTDVYTDGVYEYLDGYEISHNLPNYNSPIQVSASTNMYEFVGVPDGDYSFGVRTISGTGNKSAHKFARAVVEDPFARNVPRLLGLAKGATVSTLLTLTSDLTKVEFNKDVYAIRPVQLPVGRNISSGDNIDQKRELVNNYNDPEGLSNAVTESGDIRFLTQMENSVFLYYQPSKFSTDPYSLIAPNWSTFNNEAPFWYDTVDGSAGPTNPASIVQLTGTVSVEKDSNVLTGDNSTLFTTELSVGQMIFFGQINNTEVPPRPAKVAYVQSDNTAYLDRIISDTGNYLNVSCSKIGISPDFKNDCVLGRVYFADSQRNFDSYCVVDPGLAQNPRSASLISTSVILPYQVIDDVKVPKEHPEIIRLTATATGYTNPVFKVEGDFSFISDSEADNEFQPATEGTANQYQKSLLGTFNFKPDFLEFTVTVAEQGDEDNLDLRSTAVVYINTFTSTDGQDGQDADPANDNKNATDFLYWQGNDMPLSDPNNPASDPIFDQNARLTAQDAENSTYNFSTGVIALPSRTVTYTDINGDSQTGNIQELWGATAKNVTAGQFTQNWYQKVTVSEVNSVQTIFFEPPILGLAIGGLVTFQDLSDPNSQTEINGGLIITNTIEADSIKIDQQTISSDNGILTIPNLGVNTLKIADEAVVSPLAVTYSAFQIPSYSNRANIKPGYHLRTIPYRDVGESSAPWTAEHIVSIDPDAAVIEAGNFTPQYLIDNGGLPFDYFAAIGGVNDPGEARRFAPSDWFVRGDMSFAPDGDIDNDGNADNYPGASTEYHTYQLAISSTRHLNGFTFTFLYGSFTSVSSTGANRGVKSFTSATIPKPIVDNFSRFATYNQPGVEKFYLLARCMVGRDISDANAPNAVQLGLINPIRFGARNLTVFGFKK